MNIQKMEQLLDKWEETFVPIVNPFADNGWNQTMFETFGEELEFVRQQPDEHVWTWIDGEQGDGSYIISGAHFVNRIGYFVTEKPWTEFMEIQVDIYEEEEND